MISMLLNDNSSPEKVEISYKTITYTVLFFLTLVILYQIRQVILLLFVSLITVFALNPIINKLERFKIPRPIAILIIYFLVLGLLIGTVVSTIPIIISEVTDLLEKLPKLLNNLTIFNIPIKINNFTDQLATLPANVFNILAATFSNVVGLFTFLVITFYLLLERKNLTKYFHKLFTEKHSQKAIEIIEEMERKIGGWVRGEILLMTIVGSMSYVGLTVLGLEFALPLAVIAGILELIPNIGPTISTIPAVIVGLSVSPVMGLTVVALYFLVQQLENNLIVPKVMEKSVGLNPLVTLVTLLAGLKLGGIVGVLLAVPVLLMLIVIIKEIWLHRLTIQKHLGSS